MNSSIPARSTLIDSFTGSGDDGFLIFRVLRGVRLPRVSVALTAANFSFGICAVVVLFFQDNLHVSGWHVARVSATGIVSVSLLAAIIAFIGALMRRVQLPGADFVWPEKAVGLLADELPNAPGGNNHSLSECLATGSPVASYWKKPDAVFALRQFLDAFELSRLSLRQALIDRYDFELVGQLALHHQISTAKDVGIWTNLDVKQWRNCLALRSDILTGEEVAESAESLAAQALWLNGLALRLDPAQELVNHDVCTLADTNFED